MTRLQERNKESTEKRRLFASHPEMKERLDRLTKHIAAQKLSATATVADRYGENITYKPVPITSIAVVEAGAAGLAGSGEKPAEKAEKKEEPKTDEGKGAALDSAGSCRRAANEKKSAQASASGGPRLIDAEKDAPGGPNAAPVLTRVTAAELAAFKKEGGFS